MTDGQSEACACARTTPSRPSREVTNVSVFPDRTLPSANVIEQPPHYTHSEHEMSDVVEAWGLNWPLGNVIKYICRCFHKGKAVEDLKKARWYLNREIARLEALNDKT